ncbi:hypothetical protein M1D97_02095 [Kushneria sp. AK178]
MVFLASDIAACVTGALLVNGEHVPNPPPAGPTHLQAVASCYSALATAARQ